LKEDVITKHKWYKAKQLHNPMVTYYMAFKFPASGRAKLQMASAPLLPERNGFDWSHPGLKGLLSI
jgi:hypothetical protein